MKLFHEILMTELTRAKVIGTGPELTQVRTVLTHIATVGTRRVTEIADDFEIDRRTVSRMFKTAGLPPPQQWARIISILQVMLEVETNPGLTLTDACKRIGFPDHSTFSNTCLSVTGLRSQDLQAHCRHAGLKPGSGWLWILWLWLDRNNLSKHLRYAKRRPAESLTTGETTHA